MFPLLSHTETVFQKQDQPITYPNSNINIELETAGGMKDSNEDTTEYSYFDGGERYRCGDKSYEYEDGPITDCRIVICFK